MLGLKLNHVSKRARKSLTKPMLANCQLDRGIWIKMQQFSYKKINVKILFLCKMVAILSCLALIVLQIVWQGINTQKNEWQCD